MSTKSLSSSSPNSVLFDKWQHFSEPHLEAHFRAMAFEECRKKTITLLTGVCAILSIVVIFVLIDFLRGDVPMLPLAGRIIVLAVFVFGWLFCRSELWRPWHLHLITSFFVAASLLRVSGTNPYSTIVSPMARAMLATTSTHDFSLSVMFVLLDTTIMLIGGNWMMPSIPIDSLYWTPFFSVCVGGLYLQYYFERMDRLRWYSDYCFQGQVDSERSSRVSTELMLRFLSHEVRNPQNAIALSADSLLMEAHENPDAFLPDHIRIFEIIRSSSEFIMALLEDVLNFHRINDGKVTLALHPFCPSVFLTNLAHSLSIVLSSKRIVFLTHIDPRLAAFFCSGDKHRIQQVISNFVSNAAKFTAEGGQVKMSAMFCEPETTLQPPALDSMVRIRVAVTDSGIGISEDDQKKLFQTFSQINPDKNQSGKGMGLGLNISKGLVELHGGEIGVKSVVGHGSEFFFEIPFLVVVESDSVLRTPHITAVASTSSSIPTCSPLDLSPLSGSISFPTNGATARKSHF